MRMNSRKLLAALAVCGVAGATGAIALADIGYPSITGVSAAQPKLAGTPVPNIMASGYDLRTVADGTYPLENPTPLVGSTVTPITAPTTPVSITNYGFYGDGPLLAASGPVATLSEPDKNTYLVFPAGTVKGADPAYTYGTRFLYQGHESGPGNAGYITRINLDADYAHRVTLLSSRDTAGNQLPALDGSIWNPFTKKLLVAGEEGPTLGGIWEVDAAAPGPARDLAGLFGRGGFEGVSVDGAGNIWVVEDVGGPSPSSASALDNARIPNSYVFRFVPKDRTDLSKGGVLQALQVRSKATGAPILAPDCPAPATDACLEAAATTADLKDLHTPGTTFAAAWVPVHDTATATAAFDANALAKAAGATPFKRPENGAFRPGTNFGEFYFTETGDTNSLKGSGAQYGQFGGVFKLAVGRNGALTLSSVYVGDVAHTGFDNINFLTWDALVVAEDAGDTLHTQRNATDSLYVISLKAPGTPTRWYAQGRDPVATLRNADNEITGIYISNGEAGVKGMLGTTVPTPFSKGFRVFFTNQHGMNVTQEILRG